ncbi:MAG: hypothetical protein QNJ34_09465 [Xenococcaceae cyanobacterium MO_188.B29]|nr:hypothetical protein [Xenococcaceae cyanobacterium MO_188.B29]
MKPKFKTRLAWEQAQALMQPALIRIIDNLRKQLEESEWEGTYKEVTDPFPGYHLCLTRQKRSLEIDIWQLCYQVCFNNYVPLPENMFSQDDQSTQEVDVDTRLLDEMGEVDWQLIEAKAQQSVRELFANLPQ